MIQINQHNLKNKREAESTEHYWIEQLGAKLNSNKPYAKCKEEPKIYKENWYEEKKDYILQKAKENYEENKEQKLEYQKQYAEENKEQIKSYQEEYREKNKIQLSEQKKIYREQHKEEAKEKQKTWREANKEKLKEQKSQIINCECGCQYTFGNKHRHLECKTHIDYQNKLYGIVEEQIPEQTEEEKFDNLRQKQQEYREKNSEKFKEYKKKYNDSHKKENSEQSKKYYEEHKNEIIEQTKKYAEENKEKIKKNKDEWYQKNKEKILEKQKQLYICECGSEVRCAGKSKHNRSLKHKQFLDTNKIYNEL
jgi:glucosamine 6-phosphate synthetase-like amidotransferase/phosphosugar isomerase protein